MCCNVRCLAVTHCAKPSIDPCFRQSLTVYPRENTCARKGLLGWPLDENVPSGNRRGDLPHAVRRNLLEPPRHY
jgi:hypothetical protein